MYQKQKSTGKERMRKDIENTKKILQEQYPEVYENNKYFELWARIEFLSQNYEKAAKHFEDLLKATIQKYGKKKQAVVPLYTNLFRCYVELNEKNKAKKYFLKLKQFNGQISTEMQIKFETMMVSEETCI
jgi:tetratricopeptide (TPR) repeat protein